MNKRDLKLSKYGISGKRYKELCGFCEQYPDWKQEINHMATLSSVEISDMPRNPNKGVSDTTQQLALKHSYALRNVSLIEEVAKKASPEFWMFIIKSVCYEVPLTYLQEVEGMNYSQSSFYDIRRYFFFLLDKAKYEIS